MFKSCKIFTSIQKQIYCLLVENKNVHVVKNDCKGKEQEAFENKLLILCLNIRSDSPFSQANQTVKKVIQYLKVLGGSIVSFCPSLLIDFPSNFKELKYSEELKNVYKQCYSELDSQKFNTNIPRIDENISVKSSQNIEINLCDEKGYDVNSQNKIGPVQPQLFSPSNKQKRDIHNNNNNYHNVSEDDEQKQMGQFELNQSSSLASIRTIFKLNIFSPTKRQKLHKLPTQRGRQFYQQEKFEQVVTKIAGNSNNSSLDNNSPLLPKKIKQDDKQFQNQQPQSCNFDSPPSRFQSPEVLNLRKQSLPQKLSAYPEIGRGKSISGGSNDLREQLSSSLGQQSLPTFSNFKLLSKSDIDPNEQRQMMIAWQEQLQQQLLRDQELESENQNNKLQAYEKVKNLVEESQRQNDSQNDELRTSDAFQIQNELPPNYNSENQLNLSNNLFFPHNNQSAQTNSNSNINNSNSNTNNSNNDINDSSLKENFNNPINNNMRINSAGMPFNPFYCFMLQNQQIQQLQQSYTDELKKNQQLIRDQNSTTLSFSANYIAQSSSNFQLEQPNSSQEQPNSSLSQPNSSVSSSEQRIKRNYKQKLSSQSSSSFSNSIKPVNKKKLPFIPNREQLKQLFQIYMNMSTSKSDHFKLEISANEQKSKVEVERNMFYFNKILIPLFENVNQFIHHQPSMHQVKSSSSSEQNSWVNQDRSKIDANTKYSDENVLNEKIQREYKEVKSYNKEIQEKNQKGKEENCELDIDISQVNFNSASNC